MKSKGRPRKDHPEELIKEIIYRFTIDKKISGQLRYMDIFHFANNLFIKGEIPESISEYYWRKGEGREIIDKTNELYKIEHNQKLNDETIINTENEVNKFFTAKKSDKVKLIGSLKMNEEKLKRFIKKNTKIEIELGKKNELLKKKKVEISSLKEKVYLYENKLFQWLDLSLNKDIPLYNLISTGKTRTPIVEELLKSALSENPLDVFDKINDVNGSNQKEKYASKINTVPFEKDKNRKNVLDDIDF
ncbi:MAG: hypothetical protein ACQEV7_06965 [Bacillota bacterium]